MGFRNTVTFDIPTPSSVTTRPVISPVCAFAIRGMNSEKAERQRDRETERQEDKGTRGQGDRENLTFPCLPFSLSPCLPVSLSPCPLVPLSPCRFLICLPPFGSGQKRA